MLKEVYDLNDSSTELRLLLNDSMDVDFRNFNDLHDKVNIFIFILKFQSMLETE